MAVSNNKLTYHFAAAEDLSDAVAGTGALYKAVSNTDKKIANTSAEASGLLCQGGESGQHVGYTFQGIEKFVAGGAVAAGKNLAVTTSGYITQAASGDFAIGQNTEAAVTSGSVGTGIFNFSAAALIN